MKVFISYCSGDTDVADDVEKILTKYGIEPFRYVTDVKLGAPIDKSVEEAIAECFAAVVIISPSSVKSAWVHYEIGQAKALKKNILPLLTHPDLQPPDFLKHVNCTSDIEDVDRFFREFFQHRPYDMNTQTLTSVSASVNLNGLPPLATRSLVGRLNYKEELFAALDDDGVSVFGLIADGGIGKTALLYDWLTQLDTSRYELSHVFAWPFYDVQRRESTTSDAFFTKAFKHFGCVTNQKELNIADEKARLFFQLYNSRNAIIALDGLEAVQNTSYDERGRLSDYLLSDEALRAFLRLEAEQRHQQAGRLIVITSRLPILDLHGTPAYREISLRPLRKFNGADLLSHLGVRGTKEELEAASAEYDGHCLSLVLLGKIIKTSFHNAHIQNHKQVSSILPDPFPDVDPGSQTHVDQARRIMAFYEKVISKPEDIIALQMMGLISSAMLEQQRDYVVQHAEFAAPLRCYSPHDWSILATRLEQYGLLLPQNENASVRTKWDCHPLVREYFGSTLRRNMGAWRNAHNVLFEYFDNVAEPLPNSLAGLAPLYSAVHHACLSHDYEKGFKIYKERILRDDVQGFSTNRLGAAGEDVACLQGFLETNAQDKEIVQTSLGEENFAWLWARMAFCQTCRGNLDEAVYYRRKQSYYCTEHNNIMGAASASENLSHLHMLRGNLFEAKESADKAIELALNANDWGSEMRGRCRLGAVHYLRENIKDSLEQFDTARKLQQENEPVKPWLAFDYGLYYRFINLDLASGDEEYNDILHDAEGALGPDESWLAPFGMDKLMKGIVMSKLEDLKSAQALFDDAIDTLRESGFVIYLPYYFNFRARFELKRGELFAAGENINEGRSIASEYGLPLMKADIYITDAEIGIADRCAERARVGVEKATRLVTQYGYHYRESELQLLKGQIALLEGRASDCSRILQKIESRIERTGRVRLLKKCRELCQRAEEETKRRAQLRYR